MVDRRWRRGNARIYTGLRTHISRGTARSYGVDAGTAGAPTTLESPARCVASHAPRGAYDVVAAARGGQDFAAVVAADDDTVDVATPVEEARGVPGDPCRRRQLVDGFGRFPGTLECDGDTLEHFTHVGRLSSTGESATAIVHDIVPMRLPRGVQIPGSGEVVPGFLLVIQICAHTARIGGIGVWFASRLDHRIGDGIGMPVVE